MRTKDDILKDYKQLLVPEANVVSVTIPILLTVLLDIRDILYELHLDLANKT